MSLKFVYDSAASLLTIQRMPELDLQRAVETIVKTIPPCSNEKNGVAPRDNETSDLRAIVRLVSNNSQAMNERDLLKGVKTYQSEKLKAIINCVSRRDGEKSKKRRKKNETCEEAKKEVQLFFGGSTYKMCPILRTFAQRLPCIIDVDETFASFSALVRIPGEAKTDDYNPNEGGYKRRIHCLFLREVILHPFVSRPRTGLTRTVITRQQADKEGTYIEENSEEKMPINRMRRYAPEKLAWSMTKAQLIYKRYGMSDEIEVQNATVEPHSDLLLSNNSLKKNRVER